MTISLEQIKSAERAMEDVREYLDEMGRQLYQARNENKLGYEYDFRDYSLEAFEGRHYVGQDGPNWGEGTPIVSLRYYWSRAENTEYVTFPQSYLGEDWQVIEQVRLDSERGRAAEEEARKAEAQARELAISERRTYEKLHAKYGAAPASTECDCQNPPHGCSEDCPDHGWDGSPVPLVL